MKEFEIIDYFFKNINSNPASGVSLGIGDDCAVLDIHNMTKLLVTTDTLVKGVHFLDTAPAHSIGHKALAVNLSDIAAMGGIPKWFNLALTLPKFDFDWVRNFTAGMADLAHKYNVALIGGDLTTGPLSITITVLGTASANILTRTNAKPGDGIFVTGHLGYSKYILDMVLGKTTSILSQINSPHNKLYYPQPRIEIGLEIAKYATSAIDISDGLLADLGHVLKQSSVSALLNVDNLPLDHNINTENNYNYCLTGGDEYELLFTAPLEYKNHFMNNLQQIKITEIGCIVANQDKNTQKDVNIKLLDNSGKQIHLNTDECWQHFNEN